MDFIVRCNFLKCRAQLSDRAVVTTCCHIFCLTCAENLGLSAPAGAQRSCPACQANLPNPDDVVSTQLQPTEDYKTSVLSGLSPSIIVECAGRGLAFWSYQSTQEIVYQEYLAKTLTEKYTSLNVNYDKVINEANAEFDSLNQKLASVQIDQSRLKDENASLVSALRAKDRKQQQTQELYDRLKRKEMTSVTQSAAMDSVDEVLGVTSHRLGNQHGQDASPGGAAGFRHDFSGFSRDAGGGGHHRDGSNGSLERNSMMMPPPFRHTDRADAHTFSNDLLTPSSQHRTRLGPASQQPSRTTNPQDYRAANGLGSASAARPIASTRRPLGHLDINRVNGVDRSGGLNGYGMSAGMKVGRQPANRFANTSAGANNAAKMSNNPEFIPFAHSSQQQQHARM